MKREDEIKCPRLKKSYIASLNLRDEDHPQNVNYDAIENFKGLRKERTCTDIYCLYIFIVMNALIFSLSGLVLKDINFNRLKYGQDFRGDYCGIKQLVNESYVYWPDPVGWGPNLKACVARCPVSDNEERCLYNEFNTEYASDYCMKTYPTKAHKNYCVPATNQEYRAIVDAQMRSWSNFFISVAVDLVNLKELIGISLGAALVLSVINSALLNIRAAKINKVWFFLSFFMTLGAGGYTGFLFYSDIENLKISECSEASSTSSCARDRTYFLYGAVGFCLLIVFNSILKLLFGFPKLFFNFASMFILGQPIRRFFVFLVPFFFSVIQIMIITTSIVLFSLFMTSGYNINVPTGPDFYMPEVRKTYMTWYAYYGCFLLFFVTYLYVSFFVSVQRTIIATIVSQWYFSKTRDYLRYTCYRGYGMVYKHIGTLFYHSFIIMLVWPLRKFAAFFVHMFNNIKYANGCHMFLIKMCTCCVRFHETKWKYVFSQLIYQTVIFGDDFTIAGIKLYYLRYRNYSRYKGFETQFGIFSYFSTVLVSFVSSLVIYYYVKTTKVSYMGADLSVLEFPQLAPIITFFASLFICRGYNHLIDYGNEVMLLCFMADEEMFQGDQRFAPENVENYFNLHGTEPERKNMKNIQAQAMQKRSVKQEKKKDKKKDKNKKADPNNPDADDGNSSEEEMDDQDQAKARGEFIQAKLMQKKKEREELERERAEREKLQEQGIAGKAAKKKIQLGGDTVAGAIWKQAQRFAIKTAAEDDQVRIPKKKGADDD